MDSLTVILGANTTNPGTLDRILMLLPALLPILVAIFVPWISIHYSRSMKDRELEQLRRIKELELANSEKDRIFELEKTISVKSLEVMSESYHFTHKINRALARFASVDTTEKEKLFDEVMSAREYWERNLFYLPQSARKIVIPLTNRSFYGLHRGGGLAELEGALEEIRKMFEQLESTFSVLMADYNLFDDFGTRKGYPPTP